MGQPKLTSAKIAVFKLEIKAIIVAANVFVVHYRVAALYLIVFHTVHWLLDVKFSLPQAVQSCGDSYAASERKCKTPTICAVA